MSIGTLIFFSVVLLSVVLLFISTKDRWNWKKILLFFIGIALIICLLVGGGYWAYITISNRPHLEHTFWDIPISASKSDVKFLKGEPSSKTGGEDWDWWEYVGNKESGDYIYNIAFKKDKIHFIIDQGKGSILNHSWIQGIGYGSDYGSVVKRFGSPSHTSTTEDQLIRVLSFKKYGIFFLLEKSKVSALGIYNPIFGQVQLEEKKEDVK
jgi:4-amino-4-deoxy-L-arabinose transferase-like glycosyltransferase